MFGKLFSFAVTMALLETHDYDEKDEIRARKLQEMERKRSEKEFDDYYNNLVKSVENLNFNASYT